jgi:hypothetical protein
MEKNTEKTKEIRDFLIQAHTTRNLASNETIILDNYGRYFFSFENKRFIFIDQYVSNGHIIGQELVSEKQGEIWIPVWTMIYQGTFQSDNRDDVFSFLRTALQLIKFDPQSLPVRGPKEITVSSWCYKNICSSKILSDFSVRVLFNV